MTALIEDMQDRGLPIVEAEGLLATYLEITQTLMGICEQLERRARK